MSAPDVDPLARVIVSLQEKLTTSERAHADEAEFYRVEMNKIVAERDTLRAVVAGCPRCTQRMATTPESLGEPATTGADLSDPLATPAEVDAFMAAIQDPEDPAVAAERANYEGAMADLTALVEVARRAVAMDASGRPNSAVADVRRFLDANYPKEADRA